MYDKVYVGDRYKVKRVKDEYFNELLQIYWSVMDQEENNKEIAFFRSLTDAGKYCNFLNKGEL